MEIDRSGNFLSDVGKQLDFTEFQKQSLPLQTTDFLRGFGKLLAFKEFQKLSPPLQTAIFLTLGVSIDVNSPPSWQEYQDACRNLCYIQKKNALKRNGS